MTEPNPTFEVPWHKYMLFKCTDKLGGVLTIEQCLYTVAVYRYDAPLSRSHEWMYPSLDAALMAVIEYMAEDDAQEPENWLRAVSPDSTRRAAPR